MKTPPQPLFAPPAAREDKPPFTLLPLSIRTRIEDVIGARLVNGDTVYGSLSSSAGFVLTFDDGQKIFAKGSHPDEMSHGTLHIRREITAYERIDVLRDIAPCLRGSVSDDDEDGWTLGLWDYIGDNKEDAGAHIDDIMQLLAAAHRADVKPDILPDAATHNYLRQFLSDEKKWQRIGQDIKIHDKFLSLFEDRAAAEDWLTRHIDILTDMQHVASGAVFVQGLMHGDLRLDNIIATSARCYIVDWPNACTGPLLFDVVMLAAHIESMGYARAEEIFAAYLAAGGTGLATPNDESISQMAVLMAGYFADQAYRSIPPKLPRLRWMQKSLLYSLLALLSRMNRIESPPRMQGQISI